MTKSGNNKNAGGKAAKKQRRAKSAAKRFAKRLRKTGRRLERVSDRFLGKYIDPIAGDEKRRRAVAISAALAVNLIVFTLMSVFAKVRIFIPNAPSDTINVTMVEIPRLDLPELRDPEMIVEPEIEPEPEPEPEPEIVEEPTPEPEPEPDPIPDPEPEPPVEDIIEPEPVEEIIEIAEPEPEPAPELDFDLGMVFAPPAEDPEPLIPDPQPAAEDELSLPAPIDEEPVDQMPAEDDPEPLVSVEAEQTQEAGLDELEGADDPDDESDEDEPQEGDDERDAPPETPIAQAPQNDDIFDQEPRFTNRRFILPQVELPPGDLPADAGSSGVVAIFCPEEFDDDDKIAECAGRREIRSGWKPGASGEDWSRAAELLQRQRAAGQAGPDLDKIVGPVRARQIEDQQRLDDLRDPRRSADDLNNIGASSDDNIMTGVEGNRPAIGPAPFEPNWTLREDGELTQKEIEALERALEEAEANN